MNYGVSRGEFFSKPRINNAKLTNKYKEILKFDTGCRISEDYIINKILQYITKTRGIGYQNTVMRLIL